jgi:hypothetical protein
MKVLNLQCAGMHTFEGWFGSEDDYLSQRERNLVACPLCANTEVRKLPSAPRLNFGAEEPRQAKSAAKEESSTAASSVAPNTGLPGSPGLPAVPAVPTAQAMASSLAQVHPEAAEMVQEAWMKMVKHVIANTEDVGQNFAEEARKMHYGESEERNIRGQASVEETQDLLEEGIEVMPLPVPDALKGGLQ